MAASNLNLGRRSISWYRATIGPDARRRTCRCHHRPKQPSTRSLTTTTRCLHRHHPQSRYQLRTVHVLMTAIIWRDPRLQRPGSIFLVPFISQASSLAVQLIPLFVACRFTLDEIVRFLDSNWVNVLKYKLDKFFKIWIGRIFKNINWVNV